MQESIPHAKGARIAFRAGVSLRIVDHQHRTRVGKRAGVRKVSQDRVPTVMRQRDLFPELSGWPRQGGGGDDAVGGRSRPLRVNETPAALVSAILRDLQVKPGNQLVRHALHSRLGRRKEAAVDVDLSHWQASPV